MTGRQSPGVPDAEDLTNRGHRAQVSGLGLIRLVWPVPDGHEPQYPDGCRGHTQNGGQAAPAADRLQDQRCQGQGQGRAGTVAGLGDAIGHTELFRRKPHAQRFGHVGKRQGEGDTEQKHPDIHGAETGGRGPHDQGDAHQHHSEADDFLDSVAIAQNPANHGRDQGAERDGRPQQAPVRHLQVQLGQHLSDDHDDIRPAKPEGKGKDQHAISKNEPTITAGSLCVCHRL